MDIWRGHVHRKEKGKETKEEEREKKEKQPGERETTEENHGMEKDSGRKEEDGKQTEGKGESGEREEKDGMEVERGIEDRVGGVEKLGIKVTNAGCNGCKVWKRKPEERRNRTKTVEEYG